VPGRIDRPDAARAEKTSDMALNLCGGLHLVTIRFDPVK
jgi:hypothetical protein